MLTAIYFHIALAILLYSRSPAAYEALKSFNILQLPSRSTLQLYTGAFLHEPGADSLCIADQVAQYNFCFASNYQKRENKNHKRSEF